MAKNLRSGLIRDRAALEICVSSFLPVSTNRKAFNSFFGSTTNNRSQVALHVTLGKNTTRSRLARAPDSRPRTRAISRTTGNIIFFNNFGHITNIVLNFTNKQTIYLTLRKYKIFLYFVIQKVQFFAKTDSRSASVSNLARVRAPTARDSYINSSLPGKSLFSLSIRNGTYQADSP